MSPPTELDCLIIGAGFGGCYQLKLLRDAGFSTKIVDAASSIGGVWAWNKYPGARVDVEMPYYGYSDPAVWSTWNWTERYPGQVEISAYFEHVAKVWDLHKDIQLGVRIVSATYTQNENGPRWEVVAQNGNSYVAKYLICGTGTSFKQHIPPWEGFDSYQGTIHHSSLWPDGVDLRNKRIAIIGAGSTGVQIVQESAKVSSKVTHFIRTPNIALPMRQRQISREELYAYKPIFQHVLSACRTTPAGLPTTNTGIKTFDISEAERRELFEEMWERGGFNWSIGGLADTLTDEAANRAAYDFWAEKTRPRIKNPQKRDLLAPLDPPYYILTKRPSLEQDYYEMSDRDNVDITNSPIQRFTKTGIETADGKSEDFDIVAICTGYDAVTGGLMTMNIKGANGEYLHEKWRDGVTTFLGLTVEGFPNMFMLYGPQAPTSLTNGPPFLELECEWVRDVLERMRTENLSTIDVKREKAEAWRDQVLQLAEGTLAIHTNSWYMGANVPGKKREYLLYLGGVPMWHDACREAIKDWQGFRVEQAKL
ncbi:unnamed protein product [Cercospora beticola]|nr:unnamed protein product [Cercospora beticola]